jgi:[acyl-carrier-protein] S-malonyltransferase
MGAELYREVEVARALVEQANEVLGFDLANLCLDGPEEELRQTINTQPALYVTSCAALAALRARIDPQPFAVAGHSVGEYAAIHAAGSVSFEKGLRLVRRRAELMHAAGQQRPGAMAAILGLDADPARELCEAAKAESGGIVTVANYNCPGQIVISGEAAAVEKACEMAKSRGAKRALPLPVSGAFHSPLMVGAGDALYPTLREALFQQARVPVVTNVNAEYTTSGADFAPLLTMQVSGSVRWEESMRLLLADGVTAFIEMGSGEVLAGLLKRIDKEARVVSVQDLASLDDAVELIRQVQSEAEAASAASAAAAEEPPAATIYHIVKRDVWEQARTSGEYRADSLGSEGFIHASRREQVTETANRLFRARSGLVVLVIDAARVMPEIRYEAAANGEKHPHIYGPLKLDAVTDVVDFPPGPDGRFTLPDSL